MRPIILLLIAATLASSQAHAQSKPPAKPAAVSPAPKLIGKYDDWKVATHVEAGQIVCYALSSATSSVPAIAGRGDVSLTVTERPGAPRDAVAISSGIIYAANASVTVQADAVAMEFYTAQRSAFSRDGKASVDAFLKAKQVTAASPNPKGGTVSDKFSLKGFNAAYAALTKACPAK